MDGGGPDAPMAQVLHLVLHQRDERCDDDARALLSQRRHLEGDALAAARRHQSQRVAAAAYRLDDLALYAAEIVVAPVFLQYALVVVHRSHFAD